MSMNGFIVMIFRCSINSNIILTLRYFFDMKYRVSYHTNMEIHKNGQCEILLKRTQIRQSIHRWKVSFSCKYRTEQGKAFNVFIWMQNSIFDFKFQMALQNKSADWNLSNESEFHSMHYLPSESFNGWKHLAMFKLGRWTNPTKFQTLVKSRGREALKLDWNHKSYNKYLNHIYNSPLKPPLRKVEAIFRPITHSQLKVKTLSQL